MSGEGSHSGLRWSRTGSSGEWGGWRGQLTKQDSQPTLPELPGSRAMDWEEATAEAGPEEKLSVQLGELVGRFEGVRRLFVGHAERESAHHELTRGFRPLPLDHTLLLPDYANKVSIISDIVGLVEALEAEPARAALSDALETKFLEYYLERHYGSISNDCNNLSIQERLDDDQERLEEGQESQEEEQLVVSTLEGCRSLLSSHLQEHQEQQQQEEEEEEETREEKEESCTVVVERVRVIEVQIPVIVFRPQVREGRVEESEVQGSIDSIINRFSLPTCELQARPAVPSALMDSAQLPRGTEIELIYSDFPEEHAFKLPLDSYAQLESLISHESATSRSRPPTERDCIPANEDGLEMGEGRLGRSLLERMEENERVLNEENGELREAVGQLEARVGELEGERLALQGLNARLSSRLEEEIQQGEYLAAKLDSIDAELLEERVASLTHLAAARDARIAALTTDLALRDSRIAQLTVQLEEAERVAASEAQRHEQEVQALLSTVCEREAELADRTGTEEGVLVLAAAAESGLRAEVARLEAENAELGEALRECRRRLQVEGMSLLYDEAAEIQGIIEAREHAHRLDLQDLAARGEQAAAQLRAEVAQACAQLAEAQSRGALVAEQLAARDAQALLARLRNQRYFLEMEELVGEYDRELARRDEEILSLRLRLAPEQLDLLLSAQAAAAAHLQDLLLAERANNAALSRKITELQQAVRDLALQKQHEQEREAEAQLIEQLSLELERRLAESAALKQRLREQEAALEGEGLSGVRSENRRLREVNRALRRYAGELEREIKAVCSIDECESHLSCISSLILHKDHLTDLLTRDSSLTATTA